MPKNEEKARSVRKALTDVSSNNGGGRFSKSTAKGKKKEKEKLSAEEDEKKNQNDESLDRLLLVQSDLSTLTNQIDQLVVEAFKCKGAEAKEVEAFTNFLSEMLSSLKPWVPRFQKALSTSVDSAVDEVESVEIESPQNSLISPSPLVSWRADCTIERGRHLFKLTPLPISKCFLSSKPPIPSRSSVFKKMSSRATDRLPLFDATYGDENDDFLELVATQPTRAAETGINLESGFVSPPMSSKQAGSMVVNVVTPCLKMSPPKSCIVLEPILESSHKGHRAVHKSTPFPVGLTYCNESSGSEASEDLAFRYPELLALKPSYKIGFTKKDIDASPAWCMSPPKTCVLLEPPDEKPSEDAATHLKLPLTGHLPDKQMIFSESKESEVQGGLHQIKTSFLEEPAGSRFAVIGNTPILKEAESVVRTGPGENTLKRELWTRFEAASLDVHRFNDSATHKGFLDRLDEVSCDGN